MLVGRTIAYAAKIFMKTYFYSVTCEDHLRISRPIRRTVVFSLEILEKNDECILIFSNLLEENRIVTYQN